MLQTPEIPSIPRQLTTSVVLQVMLEGLEEYPDTLFLNPAVEETHWYNQEQ